MNKTFFVLVLLSMARLFLSCKKEHSCEGCIENNKPPIAIAGEDTVTTLPSDSVLLDGSKSSDPDGKINEWLWTKISGHASFIIATAAKEKTVVRNLTDGSYQFELKVTDDKGVSAKDTVMITVVSAPISNRPPVANAGVDQTITLPINIVNLDGGSSTDPDNNITSYQWRKIFGPSSFGITNPNTVQTQVTNLIEGTYRFELKVTDAGGLIANDTMDIIVMAASHTTHCTNCKIVFVSDRDGNPEIYSCNADGSNILRLTNHPGTDDQPTWSPDGTTIAFISDRTGNPELYIMNADGSNLVRKTFSASYSQNPTWSPDGTKIAYSTLSNGDANIWVVNTTNGSPSPLFEAQGWNDQPAWSPDGKKIALVADWMAFDLVYDIYTINADGTGLTPLTGNIFDHFDYLHPSWSPNGVKLALTISETIGVDQYNTGIGVMNSDGSGLTAVKSGAAPWSRTSWSPDGTRIAYTSLSGSRKDVSWVSADGYSSGTIVTNGWNADWQR